ncbi:restriction endonuclease subunit S [Shinella sp. M27]|uniref:restriction endonuclease subunit S n=1 Tax=Shinella sp. M27 TaxID=3368614 RepID=UPI003BA294B9
MSKLPIGWVEVTIEEITNYVSRGRSPTYTQKSDLPIINQKCIRWDGIDELHLKFVDPATWEQWSDERFVRNRDILWNSTGTGTIGRAALFSGLSGYSRAVVDTHVTIIRPSEHIYESYLFYFIKSPLTQERIKDMQSGSTNQVELNRSEIKSTVVPIAPLSEQHRIVSKIDSLSARITRAQAELARLPPLIARYKENFLGMATSGKLTENWRKENSQPDWRYCSVESIADQVFDGPFGSKLKSSDYSRSGVRVIRLENIGNLKFIAEKETYVPLEKFEELKRHELLPNDVLVSSFVSEEIRVCVFPKNFTTSAINKADCFCVRVNSDLCLPDFLAYRLASPETYQLLRDEVHGATRPRISLGHLRALRLKLPSIEEQAEIVRRIKTAFSWLDRVSSEQTSGANLLPKLEEAILMAAFSGRLVPQEPTDEPAGALIDRIKTTVVKPPSTDQKRTRRKLLTKEKLMTSDKSLEEVLANAGDWISAQSAFQLCGVKDGVPTEFIENLYAQLRDLDKVGKLETDAVTDKQGRKLFDRLRIKAV